MEYVKKDTYEVGDIIYANNFNMNYDWRKPEDETNSKTVKNFFLVVYAEASDNMTMHKKNYLALKITTNVVDEAIYACRYDTDRNPFMNKSGFISCSKMHTFSQNQIIGCTGKLDQLTLKKTFKVYHRFQCELERQFIDRI